MESFDENGESNKFHMVSDAGGNVVNVLHSKDDGTLGVANSYEYGPFGQVIAKSEAVESPYQYNTKYTDEETGLVYYGYRYYDAENGRWLNQDPIGVEGGINFYNILGNDLVNGFTGGFEWSAGVKNIVGELLNSLGVDSNGQYEIDTEDPAGTRFDARMSTEWLKKLLKEIEAGERGTSDLFDKNPSEKECVKVQYIPAIEVDFKVFLPIYNSRGTFLRQDGVVEAGTWQLALARAITTAVKNARKPSLSEAKKLVAKWSKNAPAPGGGTKARVDHIIEHVLKHGKDGDVWKYLRQAANFTAKNSKRVNLPEGKVKLMKNGLYIIYDKAGKILSYGKQ